MLGAEERLKAPTPACFCLAGCALFGDGAWNGFLGQFLSDRGCDFREGRRNFSWVRLRSSGIFWFAIVLKVRVSTEGIEAGFAIVAKPQGSPHIT